MPTPLRPLPEKIVAWQAAFDALHAHLAEKAIPATAEVMAALVDAATALSVASSTRDVPGSIIDPSTNPDPLIVVADDGA